MIPVWAIGPTIFPKGVAMSASTTYAAFGSTATVFALTGSQRQALGIRGWYTVHYHFPAQPGSGFVTRDAVTYGDVIAQLRSILGRGETDPTVVERIEGVAGDPTLCVDPGHNGLLTNTVG